MKYTYIMVSLLMYGYVSAMGDEGGQTQGTWSVCVNQPSGDKLIEQLESQATTCISLDDFINNMQQPTWIENLNKLLYEILARPEYKVYARLVVPLAQHLGLAPETVEERFMAVMQLKNLLSVEFHGHNNGTSDL